MSLPPARIGDSVEDVETPALLLDMAVLERNLDHLQAICAGTTAVPRPHAKSHKCPNLARLQVQRGAVGACCQKVGEAVALVDAGVEDVLVSNQVVDPVKLRRLATLARRARIGVCVDQAGNIDDLSAAAQAVGVELNVLVEIEVGMQRCGVASGRPAAELAKRIDAAAGLRFGGLQAYAGTTQHLPTRDERRSAAEATAAIVRESLAALEAAGLGCPAVDGGGTGTCRYDAQSGVYTELQAGSYAIMDVDYGVCDVEFEHSMFVWTQVMSAPRPDMVILDAGLKAFTIEKGLPRFPETAEYAGLTVTKSSDEHSPVDVSAAARPPRVGDKLRLIAPHCDPAVNLHDWMVCIEDERVVDLWPIACRGPGL